MGPFVVCACTPKVPPAPNEDFDVSDMSASIRLRRWLSETNKDQKDSSERIACLHKHFCRHFRLPILCDNSHRYWRVRCYERKRIGRVEVTTDSTVRRVDP